MDNDNRSGDFHPGYHEQGGFGSGRPSQGVRTATHANSRTVRVVPGLDLPPPHMTTQ